MKALNVSSLQELRKVPAEQAPERGFGLRFGCNRNPSVLSRSLSIREASNPEYLLIKEYSLIHTMKPL